MTDQDYLKICLNEINKKLNWKSSLLWIESDYVKLAKLISDVSSISISPHTLKRLFGKIKYNDQYNPQLATKDALSKFLGYGNWDDFIEQHKENLIKNQELISRPKTFAKSIKKPIFISIIGLLVCFIIYNLGYRNKDKKESFLFSLKDSIGTVPFTVPISYSLSEIISDSLFFDFNFKHPFHGKQIVTPEKKGSLLNFTYQIPGYYAVLLKKGKDTLSTKYVLAKSNGWDSYFIPENKLGEFWMDNEIQKATDSIGYLYFSSKKLRASGFDSSKVFYITHRLFQEFYIDGDNFKFETRFKNAKDLGGITCYDYVIRLICKKNKNHLNLMENGCSQFSSIKFGEKSLNGSQENLAAFKINPEEWTILNITVENKNVSIFINQKLIYKGKYQKPNGAIVGIENVFKGTGMLDYIRIKDLKTAKEFREEFN